ncbi:50S ribosomal protein L6 [Egibacter rhizosphaerae]|uniref:Large ribosomal subunit protein uL6 n=1 Tax=Egibacter rhizosphaerae TaxID=1670831 RepID=A0A411YGN8_9ACTN|nr:50S ribosomal protein L6 [Egibacter rhizosphaerae]QBI20465.1 50S ribosomal protein L6 [Egibacter rhizosphaerae]
MSRIGKEPITLPDGVDVTVGQGEVTVDGPKGTLSQHVDPGMSIEVVDGRVDIERPDDSQESRARHGLTRALIANMVHGVHEGWRRELQIVGVGYRAQKRGSGVQIQVGYSHSVDVEAPDGIDLEVPSPTQIVVSGADKQRVGQVAADIRKIRRPEPYKGKGIRYAGEEVRRKSGKAAG